MDYELAKKLKDAGFPQGGDSDWYFLNGKGEPHIRDMEIVYSEEVYIPTLSELIEACGEDFENLVRYEDGSWRAYRKNGAEDLQDIPSSTPEEAVANLWLSLQQRN